MKTNLDKMYKTSKEKELEGTWYYVNEEVAFKLKIFGGRNAINLKEATAIANRSGKKDENSERAFVKACLSDWKGLTADGEPLSFNEDRATLSISLPSSLPLSQNEQFNYTNKFQFPKSDKILQRKSKRCIHNWYR